METKVQRSPTASIDSRRSFRNCAASRLHLQPVPRPRRYLLLFHTGPPKVSTIRSAFVDGAIEALEEGKPRPRARNKTVFPRKALLFILRTSWGCVDRDTVRDGGSWLNLTASMADTIEDGVGAQHRGTRLGNSRKVATEQEMMRPPLSTMFARPIRPRAVAVLKAGGPQSAGPKLGNLRIPALVSKHKAS
jgi:hypothetical protein